MADEKRSVLTKFGKPFGPLMKHKKSFFEQNDLLLQKDRAIGELYTQQPVRTRCKNCDAELLGARFVKQNIPYVVCGQCTHLNGVHQDTDQFCRAVYTDDSGQSYASSYTSGDVKAYKQRVADIYSPKVDFLSEVLAGQDEVPSKLSYADLGAGSGYFVSALRDSGIERVQGFDVSEVQVAFGNQMLGGELLSSHSIESTAELAASVTADVVSMIGVLEHLTDPREILRALSRNTHVQYLLLSLPLFSPTVFFEMVFDTVMQRQLAGGHTHLYSDQSIAHFCAEFGFEKVGEWWFGTDMMDLYRDVLVRVSQSADTEDMTEIWTEWMTPLIDVLQLEMDKQKRSSEVQIVLKTIH